MTDLLLQIDADAAVRDRDRRGFEVILARAEEASLIGATTPRDRSGFGRAGRGRALGCIDQGRRAEAASEGVGMNLSAQLPRATEVTVLRRGRSALLCALMAMFAVLGMTGASNWHSGMLRGDTTPQAASVPGDRDGPGSVAASREDDSTDPIHVIAHAIGHSVNLPTLAVAPVLWFSRVTGFDFGRVRTLIGRDPASLLRPPRK